VTSETEWIEQARAGDQVAFGRLVTAYQTPIYNLAYRMLGNANEAEEAAQEAFLRAYTHLRSYDPQRPFRSWLFSIASHYCIDQLRKRRITWLSFKDEIAPPAQMTGNHPKPESAVMQHEQEEYIQHLLNELSPTDRAAITLLYWYDYSYVEIAEALNLTVSAVKSRLFRARRALAEMMEGEKSYAM
jgi:RNA polymerase sigma-70 factor (ECF subfamily)